MTHAVEIRSYNLKPGSRDAFHRLMTGQSLPMLQRWGVDVVACGPSPHDGDSFCLIRRYRDLAEREASQDAFYGSDEWRNGPREAVLALIDSHASVVLQLDDAAVQALRHSI
jgi:hypothetical protein